MNKHYFKLNKKVNKKMKNINIKYLNYTNLYNKKF